MANEIQAVKAHLGINVRDVEASIAFYKKMFNVQPSKVRKGYAKFDVANPPLNFTLNQVQFKEAGALNHMGIQVSSTEDVLAIRQQWLDRGLPVRDEMGTDCCYAKQNKSWVADPDGNEWEVFVVLQDNLPEKSNATGACCTPSSNLKNAQDEDLCCSEKATGNCACDANKGENTKQTAPKKEEACCAPKAAGECLDEPCCTGATA